MRSFWFTIVGILVSLQLVQGFGAGNIPDYAAIKGFCLIPQSPLLIVWDLTPVSYRRSFRHGDIENILKRLIKNNAKDSHSGGILQSIIMGNGGSSGKTFTTADIKHVYFGNWLRDYCEFCSCLSEIYVTSPYYVIAQAMDLAGLQKMTKETIIMVLSVLSFLCFGYATE